MSRTHILYIIAATIGAVVLWLWGGLSNFHWFCIGSVLAHLALLWYRGWLIDRATRKIQEIERRLNQYVRENDKRVSDLAHRPIFPWDEHKTHQRA